jgi:hypothetical protein
LLTQVKVALAFSAMIIAAHVHAAEPDAHCKAAKLAVSVDQKESDQVAPGLGHHALTIEIQNRGKTSCVVRDVPPIALFNNAKHQLDVPVCSNCQAYSFRQLSVEDVVLEPGGFAYVVIGYDINDGVGACRESAQLRLGKSRIAVRMRSCGQIYVTPYLKKPLTQ